MTFQGYRRPNDTVGIRNKILIIAVDECCDGIAQNIAKSNPNTVVLTNWYTCMLGGNEESFHQMIAVGENPNVCGVVVIAMGCGSIPTAQVANPLRKTGKPVYEITCTEKGGTRTMIQLGRDYVEQIQQFADTLVREPFPISKLVIGIKCGGSDTSSGIASNPSVGATVDKLVDAGATAIGGELFELIGCEDILCARATTHKVSQDIVRLIDYEKRRWSVNGTDLETMSIGNCIGGLTTIEEKSLGALHKFGHKPIQGVLQINKNGVNKPDANGFYLSEATMLCGGAGVNFSSYGAHIILWTTGAAAFNTPIVPVIRVSGNVDLFNEDMDIDARGMMDGTKGLDEISNTILMKIMETANGTLTAVEDLGNSTMTLYQKDQRVENLLNLPIQA